MTRLAFGSGLLTHLALLPPNPHRPTHGPRSRAGPTASTRPTRPHRCGKSGVHFPVHLVLPRRVFGPPSSLCLHFPRPHQEYEHRLGVWMDNLEFVLSHNALGKSYTVRDERLCNKSCSRRCDQSLVLSFSLVRTPVIHAPPPQLGMNAFADLTYDEFAARSFGYNFSMREPRATANEPFRYEDTNAPEAVDWRDKGAVAEVKNQAQVGGQLRRRACSGSGVGSVHLCRSIGVDPPKKMLPDRPITRHPLAECSAALAGRSRPWARWRASTLLSRVTCWSCPSRSWSTATTCVGVACVP